MAPKRIRVIRQIEDAEHVEGTVTIMPDRHTDFGGTGAQATGITIYADDNGGHIFMRTEHAIRVHAALGEALADPYLQVTP